MKFRGLMASTAIILALGGCASQKLDLPSVGQSAPNPPPINAVGGVLPLLTLSSLPQDRPSEQRSGKKRPNKAEMKGTTWITELDPDSEYLLPVQTTNATGTRTVQQTLVTADLPIGQGACSHRGFEAVPFGPALAIAPYPGAPVGADAACSIMVGGQIAKLIVTATNSRGISELRFKARKNRNRPSFPTGICSNDNYKVSKLIEGGPLAACTVVDASGANTATYFTISGSTEAPVVNIGDGETARLARSSTTRLPNGELLVRVQGSHKQLVLKYPNGDYTALTRGF